MDTRELNARFLYVTEVLFGTHAPDIFLYITEKKDNGVVKLLTIDDPFGYFIGINTPLEKTYNYEIFNQTDKPIDVARVSWGEIIEILAEKLIVQTPTLVEKKLVTQTKTIVYLPELLPELKVGDTVAIYYGFAPIILTPDQKQVLEENTHKLISQLR